MRKFSSIPTFTQEYECFLTTPNNVEPTKHNAKGNVDLV